ncbi:carboxyl transferase domain-containing protein [Glutamicibacter sp.]|uniref:carboxyl transferase domain-containing protein n=1 Tax=Glutamicibacter sp. TaxID=1931995 RepID=UPI0028BDB4A9|nr:carboxyl transferase domain-containing protein [Glutamicibacter sp.]
MNRTTVKRYSAIELIDAVIDEGTFRSWDSAPQQPFVDQAYADDLKRAADKSGVDEAVLTGEGRVQGRRVAVIVSEFRFLAGSIGMAAVDRIVDAVRKATAEGLPLLAGPCSGGTRMQEGTQAFLGMVAITQAVREHKDAGLPYLTYLRNPTTGGVMASWGSLGHLTIAEPGALLGFLGPRVYEALYHEEFPAGVQLAENLYRKGLIDAVVSLEELPSIITRVLDILLPGTPSAQLKEPGGSQAVDGQLDAWEAVQRSRNPKRPDARMVLASADDVLPLSGTGQGENEPRLILALATFGTQACVVVAQQKPRHDDDPDLGPVSLRIARRGMRLAQELQLPLLTLIDTAGAQLSPQAEEGGLASEIARCLSDLVALGAPSVSVLLGQGTGGAALALLPADRTIASENSWLSPLPPEGASAIIHRSALRAAEMARSQRISVAWLRRFGVVDRIVPEPVDASLQPRQFSQDIALAIEAELAIARSLESSKRLVARTKKYSDLGRSVSLTASSDNPSRSLGRYLRVLPMLSSIEES